MTNTLTDNCEVTIISQPAKYIQLSEEGDGYEHQRIVGSKMSGRREGLLDGDDHTLTMPRELAHRFMDCVSVLQEARYYNCHRFSRAMTGLVSVDWDYDTQGPEPHEHYAPPASSLSLLRDKKHIEIGCTALLVVSFSDYEQIAHSVVGLGDNTGMVLHFTAFGGMLSLVRGEALTDYYQKVNPDALAAALYRVNSLHA